MIENPWFLLLLLLILIYYKFWNKRKFYFRHPCVNQLGQSTGSWWNWQYFVLLGSVLLVIASANVVWKMTETQRVQMVHKYVLVNDGSSSMVNPSKQNGIGDELKAVLSGNEKLLSFLGNRSDNSKDLVGAIVFADDAFTVSSLCDDPSFVNKKLLRIDYRVPPMAGGTNISAGIWAAVEMVLSHENAISQDDLDKLQFMFYGQGFELERDALIGSIIAQKGKFAGSSIIFFTDGMFAEAAGNSHVMSTYKLINFCRDAGIRVYFISIFELDQLIARYCKSTGGRGEVVKGYKKSKLEAIYEDIASSQAKEYVVKEETVDRSFAQYFGISGLILVLLGLLLHNTKQLNFTEV